MLILIVALQLCMFASTGWAVQRFFTRPDGKMESAMVWLRRLVIASFALQTVDLLRSLPLTLGRAAAASLLYVVGLALFWSATLTHRRRPPSLAYSQDAPEHLVTDGPYALMRHPFYTAYMFGWFGGYAASGLWSSLIPAAVLFALYDRSARLEERKFAGSALGAEYARYVSRTGRYLPNPWKVWRTRPLEANASGPARPDGV